MEYDDLDPEQKRKYDLVKGLIERAKKAMDEEMERVEEEFYRKWVEEREKNENLHRGTVGGKKQDAGDSGETGK